MKWINRIKCRFTTGHTYNKAYERLINTGMSKMIVYRCPDCGSEKVKFI